MHTDFRNGLITMLILVMLGAGCLAASDCYLKYKIVGSQGVTKERFDSLMKETSIGDNTIYQMCNDMRKALIKLYVPAGEEDITDALNLISEYSTEDMVIRLAQSLDSFKEGKKGKCTADSIGIREDGEYYQIIYELTVSDYNRYAKVFFETYINGEGKIYKYDAWYY